MRIAWAMLYLAAVAAPAAAQSPPVMESISGAEMAALLQDWGYRARLYATPEGAPEIASATNGVDVWVRFFDCDAGAEPRCRDLRFAAGFAVGAEDGTDDWAVKVNDWNGRRRFHMATAADGNVFLDADLTLAGGVTAEHLRQAFALYEAGLAEFMRFIDW